MTQPDKSTDSAVQRYIKLAVLVFIAGNIYPLIYLRQNFEVSILESFGITGAELGEMYAMLGVLYMVTYLPSGWLADRVAPRILMSFSLAFAGLDFATSGVSGAPLLLVSASGCNLVAERSSLPFSSF